MTRFVSFSAVVIDASLGRWGDGMAKLMDPKLKVTAAQICRRELAVRRRSKALVKERHTGLRTEATAHISTMAPTGPPQWLVPHW